MANFKAARAYDYKSLLYEECLVGGNVSVEMMKSVTDREIAAGRMDEEHSTRKIAVQMYAAPHMTHAELLAKTTPRPIPAYGLGYALGRKLKSLFK